MALFKTDPFSATPNSTAGLSCASTGHPWEGDVNEVLAEFELDSTQFDDALELS